MSVGRLSLLLSFKHPIIILLISHRGSVFLNTFSRNPQGFARAHPKDRSESEISYLGGTGMCIIPPIAMDAHPWMVHDSRWIHVKSSANRSKVKFTQTLWFLSTFMNTFSRTYAWRSKDYEYNTCGLLRAPRPYPRWQLCHLRCASPLKGFFKAFGQTF